MYFIHYSNYKIYEGASKQSLDPHHSTGPGPRPWFWNSWIRHNLDLKATDFDHVNSKNA